MYLENMHFYICDETQEYTVLWLVDTKCELSKELIFVMIVWNWNKNFIFQK